MLLKSLDVIINDDAIFNLSIGLRAGEVVQIFNYFLRFVDAAMLFA